MNVSTGDLKKIFQKDARCLRFVTRGGLRFKTVTFLLAQYDPSVLVLDVHWNKLAELQRLVPELNKALGECSEQNFQVVSSKQNKGALSGPIPLGCHYIRGEGRSK